MGRMSEIAAGERGGIDWGKLSNGNDRDTLAAFRKFHEANPHIYAGLIQRTRTLLAKGYSRVSMSMLIELARWDWMTRTTTAEPFKLNNNYKPYYTRLIEQRCPELRGVYTKRDARVDRQLL